MNNLMSTYENKKYQRLMDNVQKNSYQCKNCGRKEIIRPTRDRKICSHCGNYIYKSEKIEKKYKFIENLRKEMREK